jgi:DNA-binding NarL/FixJ family response regulator
MTRARVLLADDHELFRVGLVGLINAQPDMEVAGQAEDGLEALALARNLRPDLIVMDIKMPVCDGLEATRLIRADWPEARILILTVHDEDEKLFEAIKAGASGYLLKSTHSPDFLRGVRAALAGEAALPPKLAARLLDEFARLANRPPPEAAPHSADAERPDLTSREREVLNLIAADATDKEIAGQLSLSLHTVKTHVRNILSKLHAVNRRHAAKLATQEGWVNKQGT